MSSDDSPTMVKEFMPLVREDAPKYQTSAASTADVFSFTENEMCNGAYVPGIQPAESVLEHEFNNFGDAEGKVVALMYNLNGYLAISYTGSRADANAAYLSVIDPARCDAWCPHANTADTSFWRSSPTHRILKISLEIY